MLSQYNNKEMFYSVAFYSYKIILTEYNYEIYDKKLLIILKTFKNWQLKLKKLVISIIILTNH